MIFDLIDRCLIHGCLFRVRNAKGKDEKIVYGKWKMQDGARCIFKVNDSVDCI